MTDSQRQAIKNYWGKFGVDFNTSIIDLDALFQRSAPKILDIGSGMGDTTALLAQRHPENDYLAVEVHRPGIGSLLRLINTYGLNNIRISNHDVMDVLQQQIAANSLDMVYVFFPDPWPKKRHHKRRLINPDSLALLKYRMKSHARLYIATDWKDYAEHIHEALTQDQDFINLAGSGRCAPRPWWRPLTKFERRGQRLKHQVWDFVFMRSSSITTPP